MSPQEYKEFTTRWLPAWTGNRPELLASFYSEDAFYSDPAIPKGVRGRAALTRYFKRLLGANPDWVWTNLEIMLPNENGFLNKWLAKIPVAGKVLDITGVCSVEFKVGLICRNEVYFDRSRLISAMKAND